MSFPSVMHFGQTPYEPAYRRPWSEYPHEEPFKCDIVMAVKLMGKEVYQNTRYQWDQVGEDIGWCHSCEELGYERWSQPKARGLHLYDRELVIGKLRSWKHLDYPQVLSPLWTWYK